MSIHNINVSKCNNLMSLEELEDARLLELAIQRMNDFDLNKTIPASEVYGEYDIDSLDEVEFE